VTKLEQLHLFLKFHFAPDSDAKREIWETCYSYEYNTETVAKIARDILDGVPGLSEYEAQMLRIVAEPGPPDDKQWAERIRATASTDVEAAHADADRLLVNLVKELGYDDTAQAWQSIDKWYA
jgi:hypothetical protein